MSESWKYCSFINHCRSSLLIACGNCFVIYRWNSVSIWNYWWFYMKLIDQPSYNLSWLTFSFVAFRSHWTICLDTRQLCVPWHRWVETLSLCFSVVIYCFNIVCFFSVFQYYTYRDHITICLDNIMEIN